MIDKITLPDANYNVPDYDEEQSEKINEIVEEVNRQENDISGLETDINAKPVFFNNSIRFETGVLSTPAQSLAGVNYYRDTRIIQFGKTFKKPPLVSIQEETAVPHVVRATARDITTTSAEIVTTRADTLSTGIVVSFIGEV